MGAFWIIDLGALFIWAFKGFSGTYSSCKNNRYSGLVGILVLILFTVILYLI